VIRPDSDCEARRPGRYRVLQSRRRSARHRLFRPERARLVDLRSAIRHAPDLCVEILSPSTEATDRGRKLQMFARYRVPEYRIVDPDAEVIEVHRLASGGYVLTQRASGDDEVRSAVVGGAPIRARQIFP
jgi:Uma2 family endonuclease